MDDSQRRLSRLSPRSIYSSHSSCGSKYSENIRNGSATFLSDSLQEVNASLLRDPLNPSLLYKRSIIFENFCDFEKSLQDSKVAFDLCQKAHSLEPKYFYRVAKAEYNLGLYRESLFTICLAKKFISDYLIVAPASSIGSANNNLVKINNLERQIRQHVKDQKEVTGLSGTMFQSSGVSNLSSKSLSSSSLSPSLLLSKSNVKVFANINPMVMDALSCEEELVEQAVSLPLSSKKPVVVNSKISRCGLLVLNSSC